LTAICAFPPVENLGIVRREAAAEALALLMNECQ
jgi:hypothetical protein